MKEKELRDYIPFIAIQDGIVRSKRGDLTFGWRVLPPTAYTVNEADYDSIIHTCLSAYKLLPPWCVILKQDVFKYDSYEAKKSPYFLRNAYEKHFEGRKFLNGYCYIFLTFSNKSNIELKTDSTGIFGISNAKAFSEDYIEQCSSYASQFEAVLKNNTVLTLEALTTEDFLHLNENGHDCGIIPDYLALYDTEGPDYNIEADSDCVKTGDNILKVWYVEDSDAYPASVSSTQQVMSMSTGTSQVFLSGGSALGYSLKIPHVVNRYILTLPKKTVEKELDSKKRLMNSFSNYSSECAVSSVELEKYLLQAANDNTITVKCFMDVLAWGKQDDIASIRNSIVSAFSSLDVSCVEETLIAHHYFYSAIPGNAADLGYDNYLNSEITAFLCHGLWEGFDFGMEGGLIHVCDRNRMIPEMIDIQSKARERGLINAMNSIVVGPSGSGKSFTMNSLVEDMYEAGEHICIIDVGDSYEGLCSVINEESKGKDGVYNSYDPEHPYSFNPFKGRKHWDEVDEDGDRTSSGYEFIISIFQTVYSPEGGWDEKSRSILDHLLMQFFKWWDEGVPEAVIDELKESYLLRLRKRAEQLHKKFDAEKEEQKWENPSSAVFPEGRQEDPRFDDFYQYLTRFIVPMMESGFYRMGEIAVTKEMLDINAFGIALDVWKEGGKYGYMLNAREEKDLFASRFTVFEVDKIKGDKVLFPIWVLCIMHSFEDKMRRLSCHKVLIIEEAWSAIATPSMAGFIVWMWRTARKFQTSAMVVTQSLDDLISSEIVKDAIIQNSDIRILLDQRRNANNFDRAVQVLGMSPVTKNLVLSVNQDLNPDFKYKECFFSIGDAYSNVFAIEVSLEQALCFETNKALKKPLFDLAKTRGSMIAAIKETAEKIRRENRRKR